MRHQQKKEIKAEKRVKLLQNKKFACKHKLCYCKVGSVCFCIMAADSAGHMGCCVWATHQLLNDSLYHGGEGDVVSLSVVINIFDQFGDHLCVCLWLKLISFGDLRKVQDAVCINRNINAQMLCCQSSESFIQVVSYLVLKLCDKAFTTCCKNWQGCKNMKL